MILLSAALLAAAQPAPAPSRPAAVDYGKAASWLCLPGRADICARPLPTTALNPNGYGSTGLSGIAKSPPVDCFYVYPTVSSDAGMNSDLAAKEEIPATQAQLVRFASVCRPFAPLYRQMTVRSITATATGADIRPSFAIAYGDVVAAFRNFLARGRGRPFILVGHSQGSWMLQELIAREIEGRPVARRMRLAIIPGFNVLVPQGKLVGGTFKSTPLCSRPGESGCVITYVSYREKNVPPEGALFGFAPTAGMTVGCVNPARPGSRGWHALDSYWNARSTQPVPGGPISWSADGAPPTPFLRTEGLVSARCVNDGQRGYLSVRTNADPRDKRTDRVGGEVGAAGFFIPGWGMHLADFPAPLGDLVRAAGAAGRGK